MTRTEPADLRGAPSRRGLLLLLALALALVALPRALQWRDWTRTPEAHFAGEVMVASTDSYHYFRAARQMQAGSWDDAAPDPQRNFPDGASRRRIALLPRVMAALAERFDTSVYRAGMGLCLLLAVGFVVPMLLYFARCGVPMVGLVGACLGGLSPAYLQRTSVYRVDTDGGNLLLCWLVSWALLGVLQAQDTRRQLGWSAAAGLASGALALWYAQPGFLFVFGGTLFLCALATGAGPAAVLRALAVYALCAGPSGFAIGASDAIAFARGYLLGETGAAGSVAASFPNVLDEIHELARLPLAEALASLQRPWPLAALGLLGFAGLVFRLGRNALPLLPLLVLGGLGLVHSMRFLMYLAPLAAAGLGACLLAVLGTRVRAEGWRSAAGVGLVLLLLPGSAAFETPRPRMTVAMLHGLQSLAALAPPGTVALAPWNEGYALLDVAGVATFGDGQAPDPVVEQLIALALVSPEPQALRSVSRYLASHSRRELYATLESGGQGGLMSELIHTSRPAPAPLVAVLTQKTLMGFTHVFRKAFWSFETRSGPRGGYDLRSCSALAGDLYRCSKDERPDLVVDLGEGSIGGERVAGRSLRVREGEVVLERSFERPGLVLQLVESEQPPHTLHLLDEHTFRSNFNQLFVLGRHDPALVTPLVDASPELRAYLLVDPRTDSGDSASERRGEALGVCSTGVGAALRCVARAP